MLKSRFMGRSQLPVPGGNSIVVPRVRLLSGAGSWAGPLGVIEGNAWAAKLLLSF